MDVIYVDIKYNLILNDCLLPTRLIEYSEVIVMGDSYTSHRRHWWTGGYSTSVYNMTCSIYEGQKMRWQETGQFFLKLINRYTYCKYTVRNTRKWLYLSSDVFN